jgi:hypothetical protein
MTFFLLLTACTPVDANPAAEAVGCVDCSIGDDSQTLIEPSLESDVVQAEAGADIHFEWSGLKKDVYGRDVSWEGGEHEAWLVSSRTRSLSELVNGMVSESLDQAALTLFVTCLSDDLSCQLSEFRLLDGAADVQERFAVAEESWGLVVVNPRDGGLAAVVELVPAAQGGVASVAVEQGGTVRYTTDLAEVAPVAVRAGDPAIRVDWSGVSTDSLGATMGAGSADELFLVRTALTPAELEASIYDLDAVAEERWSMPIGHVTAADLSGLEGDTTFTGIDRESTWLLGLNCRGCSTPAPRLLTVLEAAI